MPRLTGPLRRLRSWLPGEQLRPVLVPIERPPHRAPGTLIGLVREGHHLRTGQRSDDAVDAGRGKVVCRARPGHGRSTHPPAFDTDLAVRLPHIRGLPPLAHAESPHLSGYYVGCRMARASRAASMVLGDVVVAERFEFVLDAVRVVAAVLCLLQLQGLLPGSTGSGHVDEHQAEPEVFEHGSFRGSVTESRLSCRYPCPS